MDHAVAIDHRIAVRRERSAQSQIRIDLAALVEVDDAQVFGALDLPLERRDIAAQKLEQRGLAAAIRSHQSDSHAGGDGEVEIVE